MGFIIKQPVSKKISFGAGFYYSNKSFSEIINIKTYKQINADDPIIQKYNRDLRFTYSTRFIDIPLDIQLTFRDTRPANFYLSAGLVNSFRIGYRTSGDDSPSGSVDVVRYNKYLAGAKIGVGIPVAHKKAFVYLEPQMRIYLNRVHERWLAKNPIYVGLAIHALKSLKSD